MSNKTTYPKSRITNAEFTVIQLLNKEQRQEGAVFLPALTFFVSFLCQDKKENEVIKKRKPEKIKNSLLSFKEVKIPLVHQKDIL